MSLFKAALLLLSATGAHASAAAVDAITSPGPEEAEDIKGKQTRRWSQVASQQRQQAKEKGFSLISVPS